MCTLSIDIVVATYKRNSFLPDLCSSILKLMGENDRLYVVSQCNSSGEISSDPRLHLSNLNQANLPLARNAGITAGCGDIILFLDDDVVCGSALLEKHRQVYTDCTIGAVAGFVDDPLFTTGSVCPSRIDITTGECIQNFSVAQSQDAISVMGANMSFSRRALSNAGMFDPNFKKNALWEDVDMAFRIREAGYRIWYCSEAKVKHLRAAEGGCRTQHSFMYIYHLFANTAYFLHKHSKYRFTRKLYSFWWHRLEYLTRMPDGKLVQHNPLLVMAGLIGWCAGVLRYLKVCIKRNKGLLPKKLLTQESLPCV